MHALSRRQLTILVVLTLVWGLNWPVMKLGVTSYPPLSRRGWTGVSAAAVGVLLLLWHELTQLAGRPFGVVLALVSDWTAVALMMVAILSVLWPARTPPLPRAAVSSSRTTG